jgi:hypothetical protein
MVNHPFQHGEAAEVEAYIVGIGSDVPKVYLVTSLGNIPNHGIFIDNQKMLMVINHGLREGKGKAEKAQ